MGHPSETWCCPPPSCPPALHAGQVSLQPPPSDCAVAQVKAHTTGEHPRAVLLPAAPWQGVGALAVPHPSGVTRQGGSPRGSGHRAPCTPAGLRNLLPKRPGHPLDQQKAGTPCYGRGEGSLCLLCNLGQEIATEDFVFSFSLPCSLIHQQPPQGQQKISAEGLSARAPVSPVAALVPSWREPLTHSLQRSSR